jgi:hypothetical protein
MKTVRTKFAAAFLLTAATFFAVILATAADARAQTAAPQRDLSSAERDIRAMESQTEKKRDSKTTMAEVNEDFGRLRAINDEFKSANSSGATLNYKSISDSSVEIKKRATRLKTNLSGLPKPDKDEKRQKESVPADGAQMKSLLSSLNDLMTSFLTNPVFSDMGTLDNQLAAKARRDLESLIDLSDIVRRGAEKLGKQAGQ